MNRPPADIQGAVEVLRAIHARYPEEVARFIHYPNDDSCRCDRCASELETQ